MVTVMQGRPPRRQKIIAAAMNPRCPPYPTCCSRSAIHAGATKEATVSPQVATREEWLTARKELLTKEKEVTRMRDAVSEQLRALPMVKLDKDYEFDGPDGKVRLLDLVEGRK